jgi:TetR/AcrR family transcriptional regulator, tetracycline repressor protein
MAKLNRETVVAQALDLLDEVGLEAISTRQLARRLGVEQPSLYWHFRKKEDLLTAMAEAAMIPLAEARLPTPSDDWREWFLDNTRTFRRALLMRRDGAKLHAGTRPAGKDLDRLIRKIRFLIASGFSESDARMAMLTASRFTVGSVLEEQAEASSDAKVDDLIGIARIDFEMAFETGLKLILDGLAQRMERRDQTDHRHDI